MSQAGEGHPFANMPALTRLTFARFEPAEPRPSEESETVRLAIDEDNPKEVVVIFEHCAPNWGFGSFTIVQNEKGVFIDTECTSMEQVKAAICSYLDTAVTDYDKDPERHRAWSEAFGNLGQHGPACDACFPEKTNG